MKKTLLKNVVPKRFVFFTARSPRPPAFSPSDTAKILVQVLRRLAIDRPHSFTEQYRYFTERYRKNTDRPRKITGIGALRDRPPSLFY